MERTLLYLALIASSSFGIYSSYRCHAVDDQSSSYMSQKWNTELGLLGKTFPDVTVKKISNGQVTTFDHEIKQSGDWIVLITSQDVCSTCRDRELEAWREFKQLNPDISIFYLVAEDHPLDDEDIIKSRGLFPENNEAAFIDTGGLILPMLGLNPKETPVVLFINWESKKITLCDQALPESSLNSQIFRKKVRSLRDAP